MLISKEVLFRSFLKDLESVVSKQEETVGLIDINNSRVEVDPSIVKSLAFEYDWSLKEFDSELFVSIQLTNWTVTFSAEKHKEHHIDLCLREMVK